MKVVLIAALAVAVLSGCGGGSAVTSSDVEGIVQSGVVENMPISAFADGETIIDEVTCVEGASRRQFECVVTIKRPGETVAVALAVTCDGEQCVWRAAG